MGFWPYEKRGHPWVNASIPLGMIPVFRRMLRIRWRRAAARPEAVLRWAGDWPLFQTSLAELPEKLIPPLRLVGMYIDWLHEAPLAKLRKKFVPPTVGGHVYCLSAWIIPSGIWENHALSHGAGTILRQTYQ